MPDRYPVLCPIVNRLIDEGECFDVHGVFYHTPESCISSEFQIDGYKEICLNCQYHREDA